MHDTVLVLARENAHPRDAQIEFDEAKHTYTVDGEIVVGSVSSLWGSRFEAFDAQATAHRCYKKWSRGALQGDAASDADAWTYLIHYVRLMELGGDAAVRAAGVPFGAVAEFNGRGYSRLLQYLWAKGWSEEQCTHEVVELWSKMGDVASSRGTYVHLQCELESNEEPFDTEAVEVGQYIAFRKDHPGLKPYRTEWSVWGKTGLYTVSGQIDAVFQDDDGEFHMIDYKCCVHELTPANPFGRVGFAPFENIPDTPWGHYACQQNIYRYVLERYYGVRLRSARLLRVHATIDTYELVEVPDLRRNVAFLFDDLAKITKIPNVKKDVIPKLQRFPSSLIHARTSTLRHLTATTSPVLTKMTCAMKLKGAAEKLNVQFTVGQDRVGKTGMGLVHRLTHQGSDGPPQMVCVQMPRATTFGVRDSKLTPGKFSMTLNYRLDQKPVVEHLKAFHDKLKAAIVQQHQAILPNTTFKILEKLLNKNPEFPTELLTMGPPAAGKAGDVYHKAMELFMDEMADKVDDIFTFGASEAHIKSHKGRPKMVTYSPGSIGGNGKVYESSYMVSVACPQKRKLGIGGGFEFHPASEDGTKARPVFEFTACESPESNLRDTTEIENINVFDKLSPTDGMPFARDGVAVVSFPYVHVREDETSISVNMSLEHFHCYQRDSILGKRTFVVMDDEDTPQDSNALIDSSDLQGGGRGYANDDDDEESE